NVKRVLARVFDLADPVNTPAGENKCWQLAEQLIPDEEPGNYNQAVMEIGATICTPRNPRCHSCPLNELCRSFALGNQVQRPVMQPKPFVPTFTVA
ncbi:MAG TPA: A/G-specific adenine glycosylase, partial [Anaerolineaceae bacterium]|nr:A/G-specific adenine glycosylase [Anaerolineaceae bacterium]